MTGIEGILGPLVAGAGNVAGGEAAQALMGKQVAPPGGGIPGLTTSKGSGKNGQTGAAVQVDPSTALNFYQNAANQYKNYATQGLQYYTQNMNSAISQIQQGYANANNTLQPLSTASNEALNQELRMLGLNPIPASNQYISPLTQMGAQYAQIASQEQAAQNITDPAQRAAALSQLRASAATLTAGNAANPSSVLGARPAPMSEEQWISQAISYQNSNNVPAQYQSYGGYLQGIQQQQSDWDARAANIKSQQQTRNALDTQAAGYINQFTNNYTTQPDLGFTGDQATKALQATPGYQFQFNQGQNALLAQAAASGQVGSGATSAALINYGQNYANSAAYQGYLSNLANTVQQGAAATGQISTNQANQGLNIGNLFSQAGQAYLNTYSNIGQAYNQANTNSGQTWTQIEIANMQAQNQARSQANAQQAQAANAGLGAAASLAPLAQQNANSYSQAAGYIANQNPYSGGGGYLPQYSSYGNNFTNYSPQQPATVFNI